MIIKIIQLDLLNFFRAKGSQTNIALKVLFYLWAVLLVMYALLLGFSYNYLAAKIRNSDPSVLLNSFVLPYLVIDILIRNILQKIRGMNVNQLMSVPFSKNLLVNYVILKNQLTLFSFIPLLFFIPAGIVSILPRLGFLVFGTWVLTIISVIAASGILNLTLQKLAFKNTRNALILIIILIALYYLYRYQFEMVYNFSNITVAPFFVSVYSPFITWLITIFLYSYTKSLFNKSFYLDLFSQKDSKSVLFDKAETLLLSGIRENHLLILEIKLLFRNKRSRFTILSNFVLIAILCLMMNYQEYQESNFFRLYFTSLLVFILPLTYLQFLFAWESKYFDAILVNPIVTKKYISNKFIILFYLALINLILTIPYILMQPAQLLDVVAVYFFQNGVTAFIIMVFSLFNTKYFDLNEGMFSYQGKGAMQFVSAILVLLLPMGIFFAFNSFVKGEYVLLFFGISGIIFYNKLLNLLARLLRINKYKMAEGFRNK